MESEFVAHYREGSEEVQSGRPFAGNREIFRIVRVQNRAGNAGRDGGASP